MTDPRTRPDDRPNIGTDPLEVDIAEEGGHHVNGSDAVFAAVAGAAWLRHGLAPEWPVRRSRP